MRAGDTEAMIRALAPLLLILAACAPPAGTDPRSGFDARAGEPIHGWRLTGQGVAVRVASNGCTGKDSFDPVLRGSPRQGWAFDLELVRLSPDTCSEPVPGGIELEWTREELFAPRGAEISVVNPVRR
jgi:hypothetical protein